MRPSISLAMYEFEIRKDDNIKEYFEFGRIPLINKENEYYDLLDILKKVFKDLKDSNECLRDESKEIDDTKRIYLKESKIKDRSIYGQVNFGDYGNKRTIKNVPTNIEKGAVEKEDGVFEPYYFLLVIPKYQKRGCLILEQKRGRGIKDIFNNAILGSLVKYPDFAHYEIMLRRTYSKELKEKYYENGNIVNLKYNIYTPAEDKIDNPEIKTGKIETTVKIADKKGPVSPKKFFEKYPKDSNLLCFDRTEYEELKVTSEYKGTTKCFNIKNPESLIPYLNITDEINEECWEEGNPKLECINEIAMAHAKNNFEKFWEKSS